MNLKRLIRMLVITGFCAHYTFSIAAESLENKEPKGMVKPAGMELSEGQVRKVDQSAGKLTIAHGPLPNGMPPMTMSFRVKNPDWLKKIQEGQNIRFGLEEGNGPMTIIYLEVP